jgi:methyl-accepting chemotaxis protein
MSALANLRISIRLAAGFLVVLLLTAVIGIVGMNSAAKLADVTVRFHDHPFIVIENLAHARVAFRTMRMSARDLLLAETPEEIAKVQAEIDQNSAAFRTAMQTAKAAFLGDKANFDESMTSFNAFRADLDEIAAKMKAGDHGAALAILRGKAAESARVNGLKNEAILEFSAKKADAFMTSAVVTSSEVEQLGIGLLIAALVTGAVIATLIARSIAQPIGAITGVMGELAADHLTVEVPFAGRGDEIGTMAKAVRHFKDQLLRVRQLEADQEEQKRRAELDRQAAMRKMADSFEESVGKVIETVTSAATELQAASGQMASTATETSGQATTVAASAQQATANVQTVAAATEELASSIKEIAHQVERSQTVSVRAGKEAGSTTAQIRALSDNVNKIGEIVNLINDIAAQTNLLALNATIEAARAGDAGKGFAVVAGEVKNLANQTARATNEIASQIQAVQEATKGAVHAIDSISGVIGEMSEISAAVAAAVEQQSSATGEIARNVEQAAEGTAEVSSNIVSVEQAARETGAAAEQIKSSATDLSRQAEYLRHEVSQFLGQVRSDKKDMALMTWTAELNTGIASVDRYHREKFDHINEFYRQMLGGDGGKAAIALLSEISRGIRGHFDEEEALMAKHRYTDADAHRRDHKAFMDRIASLKAGVESNRTEAASQLFDYVSGWFREHIRNADKPLAVFMQSKKVA